MTPFVGRDTELAVLRGALEATGRAGVRVVAVTGDPGIGKTRLLSEFGEVARRRGARVLSGSATRGHRSPPLAPLLDALVDGARCNTGQVDPGDPPTDSTASIHLVRDLVNRAGEADGNRLVVLVDDMHWADEATVALLAQLVRSPSPMPLLVVLAYRPRQAPVRLHTALVAAPGDERVREIALGPLTEQDAQTLLGGQRGGPWRWALYRHSDGNPLHLHALAAAATGLYDTASVVVGELPVAVRMRTVGELETASPLARTVLDAAAVAGEVFEPALVAQIGQCTDTEVHRALDELAGLDLVRPVAGDQLIGFRHSVVWRAVYDAASPGWQLAAHGRAAAVLYRRGAPPQALAPHVARSARPGDLAAVTMLHRAALTVQTHAPVTAVSWLRAALRLLPHQPDHDRRRVVLLVRLAQLTAVTGDLTGSRNALHEALRLLQRRPTTRRAHAVSLCVMVELALSRPAEAGALARAELAALPATQGIGRAMLAFELACLELAAGHADVARDLAAVAHTVAQQHAVRPAEVTTLALLAVADTAALDLPPARRRLDQAVNLLDAMLDGEFVRSLRAAAWVIEAEILHERFDDALRHLDRAVAAARHSGNLPLLARLQAALVVALQARGRLPQARQCVQQAVELATAVGGEREVTVARTLRAWIDSQVGATGDGPPEADTLPAVPDGPYALLVRRIQVEIGLAGGDPAGNCPTNGDRLPASDLCSQVSWCEAMTRAELAAGRADRAAHWADRAAAVAAVFDLPGHTGLALLARAHVLAAEHPARAVAAAQVAARELASVGMVVDAARARMVSVGPLAALGLVDDSYREVKAVQAAFEACGAHRLARQAVLERRRLAARASRRTRPDESADVVGLDRLTRRERQVAALVSQGLTNRRVAQELFVTEKTVEMHLANIFAKLGVSSRAAVARLIGATGNPSDAPVPAGEVATT
ncbi:helix-turn-helix transcriptional regulator [Micromonospora echinofusca]|uniref:AAA family ATPase n=1 Tax=Micromonospora echinofusca TaxID=47858 RepID=A0ABS3VTR8_MICEH|nr:AAA family ATPase [Micromonospora echinofusca]MBO4207838.1 AAA family ATPase [Micromonospora echinofusca]